MLQEKLRNSEVAKKFIIILFILFFALPLYFARIQPGLDPSWVYMLNESVGKWIYGKDIVFTYGPLGFLCYTIAINSNLIFNIFYYVPVFFLHGYLLYRYSVHFSSKRMIISGLLFFAYSIVRLVDATYYLEYLVLLILNLIFVENSTRRKLTLYSISCFLILLSTYIKFNAAIALLCVLVCFLISSYFIDKSNWKKYILGLALIPILFIALYLLYNPSFTDLFRYVHVAIDISSGYNVSMSIQPPLSALLLALFCIGLSLALFCGELIIDRNNMFHTLLFIPVVFFAFKHGFVRADAHVGNLFSSLLLFCSIKCFFIANKNSVSEEKRSNFKYYFNKFGKWLIVTLVTISILYFDIGPAKCLQAFASQYNLITSVYDTVKNPLVESKESILPENIKEIIGNKTVAIYPMEQSMIAYNSDMNFTVMPITQAYSAYTPYLDEINSSFFEKDESAPEYIIFDIQTIDGRLIGAECPLTWNAIYQNYITVEAWDNRLLLQREKSTEFSESNLLSDKTYNANQEIEVPHYDATNELSFSADFELTLWGKIRKLFYQIPEVTMTVEFESGRIYTGRIVPENLTNSFLVSAYPSDLENCGEIFNGISQVSDPVTKIEFGGSGLQYYSSNIACKFSEVSRKESSDFWKETSKVYSLSDFTETLFYLDQTVNCSLDYIGDQLYNVSNAACQIDKDNYLSISGWIIDDRREVETADLYFVLGENCYLLEHTSRPDVGPALSIENIDDCGFKGDIRPQDLPIGTFTPKLMIVYSSGEYSMVVLRENSIIIQ